MIARKAQSGKPPSGEDDVDSEEPALGGARGPEPRNQNRNQNRKAEGAAMARSFGRGSGVA